jgi:hypothetical protein
MQKGLDLSTLPTQKQHQQKNQTTATKKPLYPKTCLVKSSTIQYLSMFRQVSLVVSVSGAVFKEIGVKSLWELPK